jgi:lipid-A-disaccharide synthase
MGTEGVAKPRILISAGETSGDLHGANLVRAIRRLAPGAEMRALGGPRLKEAGATLFADTCELGVIGVLPLFASFWRYLDLLSRADRLLATWQPDVVVTIDNPGFHFLLASRVRSRRIPLLWYIPPQLWAWASWRVHKLKRRYTHVACMFPHEERFFRERGVPVTLVGSPVVDHLREYALDEAFIRSLRARPGEKLVALLPGSRRQEVSAILTKQLVVARELESRHGPCRFVLALASDAHREWAARPLAASGLEVLTVVGKTHEVQRAADLALVASGTASLELAYYETPMVVFYNVGWAEWNLVGRWFVTTPYLSLPNALAGRRIVPEFMYEGSPTSRMVQEASALLVDEARRREAKAALAEVRRMIDMPGAAENAAREVLRLVGTEVQELRGLRPGFAV